MEKKTWIALATGILVLIVTLKLQPNSVEAVQVTQENITQTIVATGRIAPFAKIELGSVITATVANIHALEGDEVVKNQPLVTLFEPSINASLKQAIFNLQEATQRQIELQQVTRPVAESAVAQARANLTLAESEYARNLTLVQKKLTAYANLEQAKKNLDINQKALETALHQFKATQTNGVTTQLILTRQEEAKAALAIAQAKADQLIIRAPYDGRVISRAVEIGSTVQPGKTLITLAAQGETRIEIPIDEKSMRFLSPNQTATVIADAYPQQPFQAHIALIYPSIDPNRATVNVRLVVDNPPAFLRPDMTVSVEMIAGHVDNTLTLASDAIHDADTTTPWVIAIRDNTTTKQPVTLGIKGVGNTQILSGLNAGDLVVTQTDVKLNQHVKGQLRSD